MWKMFIKSFVMGFGGRLGWMLSGWLAGTAIRFGKVLASSMAAYGLLYGLAHMPDIKSPSAAQKPVQQQHNNKAATR